MQLHFHHVLCFFSATAILFAACQRPADTAVAGTGISTSTLDDPYTISSEKHLIHEIPVWTEDSLVNVIIEIPTGTLEKWEVDKSSGDLELEFRNGEPRKVDYMGYPGNYGMVPMTLSPESQGGDGDPLDVIVIGEALERGSIVPCRLIGVIELLDKGEQDDKLIAVPVGSNFSGITSLSQLREEYKGAAEILELWFANYKGSGGKVEIQAISDAERAYEILEYAIEGYIDNR